MIQSVLLFALGFFVAALLGLLCAPLIWRRGQAVMRRRLEALVPMSFDEVRADRDALRAEHALEARRLEVEVDDIRRVNAVQQIEIGRGKEALKARNRAIDERDRRIGDDRKTIGDLTVQLRARELALSDTELRVRENERELRSLRERHRSTVAALRAVEMDADARAETIARNEVEIADASRRLADAAEEAERSRRTIATLRAELESRDEVAEDDEPTLDSARPAERGPAEIEAAGLRRRVDELTRELAGSDAALRDRMADLAARIVHLSHLAEGEASPIPGLVEGATPRSLGERIAALIEHDARTSIESPPDRTAEEVEDLASEMDRAARDELDAARTPLPDPDPPTLEKPGVLDEPTRRAS